MPLQLQGGWSRIKESAEILRPSRIFWGLQRETRQWVLLDKPEALDPFEASKIILAADGSARRAMQDRKSEIEMCREKGRSRSHLFVLVLALSFCQRQPGHSWQPQLSPLGCVSRLAAARWSAFGLPWPSCCLSLAVLCFSPAACSPAKACKASV